LHETSLVLKIIQTCWSVYVTKFLLGVPVNWPLSSASHFILVQVNFFKWPDHYHQKWIIFINWSITIKKFIHKYCMSFSNIYSKSTSEVTWKSKLINCATPFIKTRFILTYISTWKIESNRLKCRTKQLGFYSTVEILAKTFFSTILITYQLVRKNLFRAELIKITSLERAWKTESMVKFSHTYAQVPSKNHVTVFFSMHMRIPTRIWLFTYKIYNRWRKEKKELKMVLMLRWWSN